MKTNWRQKLKLILMFMLIAFLTLGIECEENQNPNNYANQPPDVNLWFYPEYDYMFVYPDDINIFPNSDCSYVTDVFSTCYTDFSYVPGGVNDLEEVDYSDLYRYAENHSILFQGELINGAYILALPDALDKPNPEALGITINGGQKGVAASFIFVQAIRDEYPGDISIIEYAVIHECGHLRDSLSHLCEEYPAGSNQWYMSSEHNHNRCVMANGPYSPCTLYWVNTNPLFCDSCRVRLWSVDW